MYDTATHATSFGLPRILSGSHLKLLACVLMLIDHVAIHLLAHYPEFMAPLFTVAGQAVSLVYLMVGVSRISFPLYCFLLVEGFLHTRSRWRYARSLLAFALISEVPWDLEHAGQPFVPTTQNVFFTLLLGLLALMALDALRERPWLGIGSLAVVFALGMALHADYGIRGVALIIGMYVLREYSLLRAAFGFIVLRRNVWALPAFALMEMYDGTRGFVGKGPLKYAFYAFYPAHILVIALIKMHLGFV